MRPFQDAQKNFVQNCDFNQIIELYEFDRELRLLCLDAIDRLEVALRAAIIDALTVRKGPHIHILSKEFGYFAYFVNFWNQSWKAKSIAIDHYKKKYQDPKEPPLWVLLESLTYGTLSTFFADLTITNRKFIARAFSLHETILVSWLRSLTVLRNKCAHHNRVWNGVYNANTPIIPRNLAAYVSAPNKFHFQAVMLYTLLKHIEPSLGNHWRTSLQGLFARYANVIDLSAMGFIANDPFWHL